MFSTAFGNRSLAICSFRGTPLFGTEAVFNPAEAMGMNTIPTEIVGGLPPPNIMAKFGQAPCPGCQLSRSEQLSGDAGSSGRPDSPNGGPSDRIASWILAVFSFAALAFALYVIWVKCAGLPPFYESEGSRSGRFRPHLEMLDSACKSLARKGIMDGQYERN